ncbi:transcriptional regulator, TetR family [Catenulispora acidiphila DSM 44928]|uniref:Transcriptional regulator, TetR family n=1 Tax=Catenulispora acidiphila (strain DSM 44928 / JCM 14897 / NBRC 102108 / NRRL B-24433 / ID139908) TaxID=479433 RepID=C7QK59_CATAD|nr:TetR/AcrR family transcriptional regulator C-terminal domain-containing protein [Catenulispora acidiphila]ACU75133.1 transcriptional regulator, TetR family [Catenulispora acidiphila DSM 44928]
MSTGESHEAVAALLWGAPAQQSGGKRGPKPKLTVEQIAEAGIAIADEHGLDAVTMQHVAERLSATKMALYRYVSARTELEALMLDRALGTPGEPGDGDWQHALTRWALNLHERTSAHRWSVELVQRPHLPGPSELAWYEVGLATLEGLALEPGEKLDVLALLSGHVISIVRHEAGSGTPEADLAGALVPVLTARAQDYPLTMAAFAQTGKQARDGALRFGIERVIAGVEALISEH